MKREHEQRGSWTDGAQTRAVQLHEDAGAAPVQAMAEGGDDDAVQRRGEGAPAPDQAQVAPVMAHWAEGAAPVQRKEANLADDLEKLGEQGDKYFEDVVNETVNQGLLPKDKGKAYIGLYKGCKDKIDKAKKVTEFVAILGQASDGRGTEKLKALKSILTAVPVPKGFSEMFQCYTAAIDQAIDGILKIEKGVGELEKQGNFIDKPALWPGGGSLNVSLQIARAKAEGTKHGSGTMTFESIRYLYFGDAIKWVDSMRPVFSATVPFVPKDGMFFGDSWKVWEDWFVANWQLIARVAYGDREF